MQQTTTKLLEQAVCDHVDEGTHREVIEYDQGPESQMLFVIEINVYDRCGEVADDEWE